MDSGSRRSRGSAGMTAMRIGISPYPAGCAEHFADNFPAAHSKTAGRPLFLGARVPSRRGFALLNSSRLPGDAAMPAIRQMLVSFGHDPCAAPRHIDTVVVHTMHHPEFSGDDRFKLENLVSILERH